MSVKEKSSTKEEKATKHIVADELSENSVAVAVIEEEVQGETIRKFLIGLDDGYAEILPSKPRATRVQRFRVCSLIDEMSERAVVRINTQEQLPSETQRDIAKKVAPLRREDEERSLSNDRDSNLKSAPERDYSDVADDETEFMNIASSPIDTSEEHGGGW
jgi:hypothetical protein